MADFYLEPVSPEEAFPAEGSSGPSPTGLSATESLSILPPPEGMDAFYLEGTPEGAPVDLSQQPGLAPSTWEAVRETAYGAGVGGVQGAAISQGALRGGLLGAQMGAPFGPVGSVVGGTTGVIAGGVAGYYATKDIEDFVPPVPRWDLVRYREGGKTFGASIGSAPVAFGIPTMNANAISRFLSGIGRTAEKHPVLYMGAETARGTTAGIAGGIIAEEYPGEEGKRFLGETGAALLTPTTLAYNAITNAKIVVDNAIGTIKPSARQGRALETLQKAFRDAGETLDVDKLQKALSRPVIGGAEPSTAVRTGSAEMMMLQRTLARKDPEGYGQAIKEQDRKALEVMQGLARQLTEVGTPDALAQAAILRRQRFLTLLDARMDYANRKSADAIRSIKVDKPATRIEIGYLVKDNVLDALADAREYEKFLWKRAIDSTVRQRPLGGETGVFLSKEMGLPLKTTPEAVKIAPTNAAETYLRLAADRDPNVFDAETAGAIQRSFAEMGATREARELYQAGTDTPDALISGQVPDSFMPEINQMGAKRLIGLRSDLLNYARKAAREDDSAAAGFYGELAESLYKDINNALEGTAYDEAREYSRALNDFFTRSYAGEAKSVTRRGDKLNPETLVQRDFGAAADITTNRMIQMEEAVNMLSDKFDEAVVRFGEDSPQALKLQEAAIRSRRGVVSIRDAEGLLLRTIANDSLIPDPTRPTGYRLNPTSLQRDIDEYGPLIDRLGMREDLENPVRAENALLALSKKDSHLRKMIDKQAEFAPLVKNAENPTRAITDALSSRNPDKQLTGIIRTAKRGGEGAVDGLKATVYDYAYSKASTKNGALNPTAFYKALFDPIRPAKEGEKARSLVRILSENGVMSFSEVRYLRELTRSMMRTEYVMRNAQGLPTDPITGADVLSTFFMRVSGSGLGKRVSQATGIGSTLIAQSAGSQVVQQYLNKMPQFAIRGSLEELTKDPEFAKHMLSAIPQDAKGGLEYARQLHAYLGAAGLNYIEPDPVYEETSMPEEMRAPGSVTAPQMMRKMRDTLQVPTRGTGMPAAPSAAPAPAPAPAPTGQGAVGPQSSREMLQRLFPMDTMLG